jgi:signal transduction histidine kinase
VKQIKDLFKPIGRLLSNELLGIKAVTTLYIGGTSLLILSIGLSVAAYVGSKYFRRVIVLNMKSYVYAIKADFISNIEFEKARGSEIASKVDFYKSKKQIKEQMKKFLNKNESFVEALFVKDDGRVLCYVANKKSSYGDRYYVLFNKFRFSEVQFWNGIPTVLIKYNVASNRNVLLRLDLSKTYSMFKQSDEHESRDIFLLSKRGEAISPLRFAKKIGKANQNIVPLKRISVIGKLNVVSQAINGLGDASLTGYTNYHGEKSVAIWATLQQLDAYIIYEMAQKDAFRKPYYLVLGIVVFGIVIFGILFILILFLSKRLSKPIIKLSNSLDKISRGDYSNEPPINTFYYEVDRLWRASNHLRVDLRELAENTNKISKGELEEIIEGKGPLIDSFRDMQMSLIDRDMKIRQSQKELKKVNEELDSFVYVASHDLKEPLRAIQAFSQFLVKEYHESLDEKGCGFVNRITKNVKRMDSLITDLLNLSRVERIRNPFENTNMNNLVKNVLTRFEYLIAHQKIRIEFSDDLPVCYCDRIKMTEVFANLISNAIKYGPAENSIVKIGYDKDYDPPYFYVEDNGEGIDEKYHSKIFEMFQRLERTSDGTGAGLYIVKKIIELHSGVVWVESGPNKGSKFKFVIPSDLQNRQGTESESGNKFAVNENN